jgi:ribonucleoside-diphosphate reductase alpha chain
VPGVTYEQRCACSNKFYVIINDHPETGELFEVFAKHGKAGGCKNCNKDALCTTLSLAIRGGVDPSKLASAIVGMSCDKSVQHDDPVLERPSCVTVIARCIIEHMTIKKINGPPRQHVTSITEIVL